MSFLNMLTQGVQMTMLSAGSPGCTGQVKGESLCCSLQIMAEEKAVSMSGERYCACDRFHNQHPEQMLWSCLHTFEDLHEQQ